MLLRGLDVGGNHVPALSNTDVLASTPCRIETFLSVIISFVENSSLAVVQTRLTTWGIAGYEAAIEVNTGPYWKYYFICSAYCGGLWLASLRVMQEIATILGFPDEATKYLKILNNGKKAYHSLLWNGKMLLKFWYYMAEPNSRFYVELEHIKLKCSFSKPFLSSVSALLVVSH